MQRRELRRVRVSDVYLANLSSQFDALVSNPANQYWFQLKPGRMLLFDNWRVLHGRAAFTGKRRMCGTCRKVSLLRASLFADSMQRNAGGYINRDDFISKFRMTNMTDEDIRASTVTG